MANEDNQNVDGQGADQAKPDAKPEKKSRGADQAKPDAKNIESVVLTSVYGFIDDAERAFNWVEGQIVTDAEHIKMLLERKAPVTVVAAPEATSEAAK